MKRAILWFDRNKPYVLLPGGAWLWFTFIISVSDRDASFWQVAPYVAGAIVAVILLAALGAAVYHGYQNVVAWAKSPPKVKSGDVTGTSYTGLTVLPDPFLDAARREVETIAPSDA